MQESDVDPLELQAYNSRMRDACVSSGEEGEVRRSNPASLQPEEAPAATRRCASAPGRRALSGKPSQWSSIGSAPLFLYGDRLLIHWK